MYPNEPIGFTSTFESESRKAGSDMLIANFKSFHSRDIYSGHFPPPGGEQFLSKLKKREEFEGGLHEKRKGKGGGRRKKKKMIKHTLKYL